MIQNNSFSPLAFSDDINFQNVNLNQVAGNVAPLYMLTNRILPFQIIVKGNVQEVSQINVVSYPDNSGMNHKTEFVNTGFSFTYYQYQDITVIKYKSTNALAYEFNEGIYFIHIEYIVGESSYGLYSEHFSFTNDVSQFLKLEYGAYNSIQSDKFVIDFTDDFKFHVYLNSILSKPQYDFDELVTKRDGYQFVEKQVSEKTYKFAFIAPEYLCDALRIVRMCDEITLFRGTQKYTIESFLMTPKWANDGSVAEVEVEFQCDTVVKRIGADFISLELVNQLPQEAKMYIGQVVNTNPSEVEVRSIEERPAVKGTTQKTHFVELGKRNCFAYPASFGDLVNVYYFEAFDLLSSFTKTQRTFSFGANQVLMNIYTYNFPVTFVPDVAFTITYKF